MASQKRTFESLLEAVPSALVGVDRAGAIRFVNHGTESLFGYDRDALIGESMQLLIPDYLAGAPREHAAEAFADPRPLNLELGGRRKDGSDLPLSISLSTLDTGELLLVIAAEHTVNENTHLMESSQLLAAITGNANDAIITKTLDGIITGWNEAAERMYGYSADEMLGTSIDRLIPEDRTDEMRTVLAKIKADVRLGPFETLRVRKNGTVFPVSLTVSPIHDIDGAVEGASTIARDVTELWRAFEAARSMIESSLDSLVAISPEGLITDANEATVTATGIPRGELIGTAFSDCFTDPGKADAIYQLVFEKGMAVDYPLTMRRRDGTLVDVLYNASVYRDLEGNVLGVFAAARDVTEVRQAFEAARSMIESSLDSLVAISPEGLITDANEATVTATGIPRTELIGTAFSDYFTEPGKADAIYQLVFEKGMAVDYPLTMRRRDGTLTEVLYNASVYRDLEGNVLGVFAAARDVTEVRQAFEAARSMIETSLDSLVAISPEGLITDANEATVTAIGIPRDELIGTAFSDYFTEPDKADAIYRQVFEKGMALGYPLTIRRRDGTQTEVLYNASVYRDTGGHVLAVFAAARDVTEVRQAFEAARSMIESSLDSLVAISPEGLITDANEATVTAIGIPRTELIGTAFSDYFTEPNKADAIYQLVFEKGMAVDYPLTIRHRDGALTDVLYNASVYRDTEGNVLGVFAAARDVTEVRQAFEAARSMIESSLDSLVAISPEGLITDANEATVKATGIPRTELIGTAFSDCFTEPQKADAIYQLVFEKGMAVDYPLTMLRRDGTLTEVLYNASVYRGLGGNVLGVFAAARDVTEVRQAFEAARSMIESSLDSLVAISPEGLITDANEATVSATGIPRLELIGTAFSDCFTEPDKADAIYQLVFEKGMAVDYPLTMRRRDGTLMDVLYNASVHRDLSGKVLGVFAAARDVTEVRQAFEAARSMIESSLDSLVAISPEGLITDANEATVTATGIPRTELIGTAFSDCFTEPETADAIYQLVFEKGMAVDYPLTMRRRDGTLTEVLYNASVYRDFEGKVLGVFAAARDVTGVRQAQEAMAYQAFHDPLTGLHNRAWILDILTVDLRAAKRLGHPVGALFVDLDGFKVVNDSLGHAAGDEVLQAVAHRIVAALRPGDRVGRFGGDEFVIVIQNVEDPQDVLRCAERMSASISTDLLVRGHRIVPTVSIGIATSTSMTTSDSLLRDADSALFRAKAAGRARWNFFDDEMHAQALARLTLEDELREAIAHKQFVVYYQPIVTLANARVVGHEALVRWAHPSRGLLSPGEFLDVAEDTGLISDIGAQVLDQVCAVLAEHPHLPGPISINVSAVQLAAPGWLTTVQDIVTAHRVDPARMVIEVTETAVLSLVESARTSLASLRGLGVGIHLDDFGTGYSSISVLRDLPVTGVKLDLRFVQDLTDGESQANALSLGVSGLVNGLHLTGIAEGIETNMQAEILRAQGWECGQGYYFGRPAAHPSAIDDSM